MPFISLIKMTCAAICYHDTPLQYNLKACRYTARHAFGISAFDTAFRVLAYRHVTALPLRLQQIFCRRQLAAEAMISTGRRLMTGRFCRFAFRRAII